MSWITRRIVVAGSFALLAAVVLHEAHARSPNVWEDRELSDDERRAVRRRQPIDGNRPALRRAVGLDLQRVGTLQPWAEPSEEGQSLLVGGSLSARATADPALRPRIVRGLDLTIDHFLGVLDDLHAFAVWQARQFDAGPELDRRMRAIRESMDTVRGYLLDVFRARWALAAGGTPKASLVTGITEREDEIALILADEALAEVFGKAGKGEIRSEGGGHEVRSRVEIVGGQRDGDLAVELLVGLDHRIAGVDLPVLVELRDVTVAPGHIWSGQLPDGWLLTDPSASAGSYSVSRGRLSRTQIVSRDRTNTLRLEIRR